MAVILSSTTDSPEEIERTFREFGMERDIEAEREIAEQIGDEAASGSEQPGETTTPPSEQPGSPAPTEEKPAAATGATTPQQEEEEEDTEEIDDEPPAGTEAPRDDQGRFTDKDKLPRGVQKKLAKYSKARREAEERAIAAEAREAELRRQLEERKPPAASPADATPPPKPVEAAPAPAASKLRDKPVWNEQSQEKYETYEAFLEDVADWKVEKAQADFDAKLAAIEAKVNQQVESRFAKQEEEFVAADAQEAYNQRVEAVKKDLSDWDTVMASAEKNPDCAVSQAMVGAIQNSGDMDARLIYYFATHPAECKRIADATSYDPKTAKPADAIAKERLAVREITRIEAMIAPKAATGEPVALPTPKPAPPKPPSKAPAPIDPVRPVSSAMSTKDPDKMSAPELRAYVKSSEGRAWLIKQGGNPNDAMWR